MPEETNTLDTINQRTEIFAAFGVAIAQWQLVEDVLGNVAGWQINNEDPGLGREVFHSPLSFQAKLSILDSVIRYKFSPDKDITVAWGKLIDVIRRNQKIRNKLAHAIAGTNEVGAVELTSGPFATLKSEKNMQTFDLKYLQEAAGSFNHLALEEIREFNVLLIRQAKGLEQK